jgi:hypothetical protein
MRTRGCGCTGHPAFPTPSDLKGGTFWQTSRETRREIAKSYLVVIARSEATKQSTLSLLLLHGLLRFARNDGSLLSKCGAQHVQLSPPGIAVRRTASLPLAWVRGESAQYSRDACDGIEKPRHTGSPAGACHRARRRRDPVAGMTAHCGAAPYASLRSSSSATGFSPGRSEVPWTRHPPVALDRRLG